MDDNSKIVLRKCCSILHVHLQYTAGPERRKWERLLTIGSIERVYAQHGPVLYLMQRDYRLGVVPMRATTLFGIAG